MCLQSGVKYIYTIRSKIHVFTMYMSVCFFKSLQLNKKKEVSTYDQEIPQSHNADQPTAP